LSSWHNVSSSNRKIFIKPAALHLFTDGPLYFFGKNFADTFHGLQFVAAGCDDRLNAAEIPNAAIFIFMFAVERTANIKKNLP